MIADIVVVVLAQQLQVVVVVVVWVVLNEVLVLVVRCRVGQQALTSTVAHLEHRGRIGARIDFTD